MEYNRTKKLRQNLIKNNALFYEWNTGKLSFGLPITKSVKNGINPKYTVLTVVPKHCSRVWAPYHEIFN